MQVEDRISNAVHNRGIPLFGIAQPVRPAHYNQYLAWLSAGGHANMTYLAEPGSIFKRSEPASLMENTRSILVFGFPYPPPDEKLPPKTVVPGQLAAYALSRDYHALIPEILEKIIPDLFEFVGTPFQYRIFTDSAPVLERDIAQAAGLGWIGKNGNLISPHCGSYFLLAEMFCDLDLQPSPALDANYCGSCRRCIEACPTGCIQVNRTIDSGRCISWLTIENKGTIPSPLRSRLGNRVFGCDVCQQVCPWNRKASVCPPLPQFEEERLPEWMDLHQALQMTKEQFKLKFNGYPLMRTKRAGFLRNAAVVIGNARRPESVALLKSVLETEELAMVRLHAAWALRNISTPQAIDALRQHLPAETDPDVQNEIRCALELPHF